MDSIEKQFEGSAFTDAKLKAVRHLEKVESLSLWDTAVTDAGVKHLQRAWQLSQLSLTSNLVTDESLETIARLTELRSLFISGCPNIGDRGVSHLQQCSNLRELYLNETNITDESLLAIARLPNLWSLSLNDTRVTDHGCKHLATLPKLGLLCMQGTSVTGIGLAKLRDTPHLSIYMDRTAATDSGVIGMVRKLTNLKTLSLNQTGVGDRAAKAVAQLQKLNNVRFSNTRITDVGLAAFAGHPLLDVIYVEGCDVSAKAVKAIVKASPRELTVYGP